MPLEENVMTSYAYLQAVWQLWLRIHRAWGAARARGELHALNDRMLKDIGLRRSDIDSLFR
jgi:uncharacterized protein YjiS (DUF1127 family)